MNSSILVYRSQNGELQAKQREVLVEWLKILLPSLSLPVHASEEDLRTCLADGTVLCRIMLRLKPGSITEVKEFDQSKESHVQNVRRFLTVIEAMGLPRFEVSDLEKGSMKSVLECLLTLRSKFNTFVGGENIPISEIKFGNYTSNLSPLGSDDKRKVLAESKIHKARSPTATESSAATLHNVGTRFHEVFQIKQGRYADLPASKISEMMKANSLDNAPTQTLLSVVNGILDERKNEEIPQRFACLLRTFVQEIERRISTQAEHVRTQNNVFKAREEKYQSRIKVLEALATGTSAEPQIVVNQLQQLKSERTKMEEKNKVEEQDGGDRLMKEKELANLEISKLKRELEMTQRTHELNCSQIETEAKATKEKLGQNLKALEQYELRCSQLETEAKKTKEKLEQTLKEIDQYELRCSQLEREARECKEELEKTPKAHEGFNLRCSLLEIEVKESKEKLEQKMKENEQYEFRCSQLEKECSQLEEEGKETKEKLEEKVKEHELSKLHWSQMENESRQTIVKLERQLKEQECLLADSSNRMKEIEASCELKDQDWSRKSKNYGRHMNFQCNALQELRYNSNSIKKEILNAHKGYSEDFSRLGVKFNALADAAKNYHAVLLENRKLYNEIQDLKGNIRVFCRIRPHLPGQSGKQTIVESFGESGELVIANPSKGKEGHRMYKFNKVYGPKASQAEVFADTQPLIRSVLDGYNVCIFAYGQTGSGKTYTMTGPTNGTEEDWGVNYRALNDLFHISQKRRNAFSYEIVVQMVEIYNEQVRDLLSTEGSSKKLGVLTTSQPNGLAVPDASMHSVESTEDVMDLMDTGLRNRSMGATAMNVRSSRSHSVLSVHVRGTDLKTGSTLRGSLHLVDLAGSERVDRSEVTGDRLKEAQHINKSLSALGDVIFALAQKSSHVPYRNSKLTQVLQSSLGGQAKTLMFTQLNPDTSSYSESTSTLKFAERVSGVELGAAKSNKEGKDVKDLMDQVASLKDSITKRDEEIERLQLFKDLKNVYPGVSSEKRATTPRFGSPSAFKSSASSTSQRTQKPSDGKSLGLMERSASSDNSSNNSQQSMEDLQNQYQNLGQSKVAGEQIETSNAVEGALKGAKSSDKTERAKSTPRVSRPLSISRESSKSQSSLQKSPSVSSLASSSSSLTAKAPRRWA